MLGRPASSRSRIISTWQELSEANVVGDVRSHASDGQHAPQRFEDEHVSGDGGKKPRHDGHGYHQQAGEPSTAYVGQYASANAADRTKRKEEELEWWTT